MSELSFKYCPLCKGELKSGKISVPISRKSGILNGFTDFISFYSEEDLEYLRQHLVKATFSGADTKTTYFSAFKQPCIPAGYCEKCDRIFAEIEMRESYNPIGEETLPTYDMDYYCEDNDSLIREENIYVQEEDPYEKWKSLIEWDNSDDEN